MRKVIALVVLAAATALSVASTAGAAPGQRGFHGHGFGGGISDGR
jgi:Spy/CpxP family protein refolding chaperone